MKKLFSLILIILVAGCKEKYELPFEQAATGYLVIEGVINSHDITSIVLSRTTPINSSQKQYEQGASVQVEGDDNSVTHLLENIIGTYSAQLQLNPAKQYRLRINTQSGKEYLSEFIKVQTTPPIDSISWQRESNGVRLHFNTHDPQNATRYYKWDYVETWEFHSTHRSFLKYVPESPFGPQPNTVGFKDSVRYDFDSTIFRCWKNVTSSSILIGSSARLSSDVIYKLPFLFIPKGNQKLSELYSINVKQYALTKQAYEFYEKMKKNTEENGSIFDPQPSQLKGNIQCVTDPNEPVVGFITASDIKEKRIFINKYEVPLWNYNPGCREDSVLNHPDSVKDARGSGRMPTRVLVQSPIGGFIVYFGVSGPECVDCTLTGSNVKPPFWP